MSVKLWVNNKRPVSDFVTCHPFSEDAALEDMMRERSTGGLPSLTYHVLIPFTSPTSQDCCTSAVTPQNDPAYLIPARRTSLPSIRISIRADLLSKPAQSAVRGRMTNPLLLSLLSKMSTKRLWTHCWEFHVLVGGEL